MSSRQKDIAKATTKAERMEIKGNNEAAVCKMAGKMVGLSCTQPPRPVSSNKTQTPPQGPWCVDGGPLCNLRCLGSSGFEGGKNQPGPNLGILRTGGPTWLPEGQAELQDVVT